MTAHQPTPLKQEILDELAKHEVNPFTEDELIAILSGYRDYYADEWYRKRLFDLPFELDRQQALVLNWAVFNLFRLRGLE